jgi:hypothetical protein
MKKQKMRFISAVLAACMMTSVLPVNALALGGGTPENGVTAQENVAIELTPTKSITIDKGGNYEIPGGNYAGNITINLTDITETVNITIKGNIKPTYADPFIDVTNAGVVNVEMGGHEFDGTAKKHFMYIYNPTADVTVSNGMFKASSFHPFMIGSGALTVNDAEVETGTYFIVAGGSSNVTVNRGRYTFSNSTGYPAIFACPGGSVTLNDVTATSTEAVLSVSNSTVVVNGGNFNTTGTKSCFVNSYANLTINKGTTTEGTFASEGASCIQNSWGRVEINGGTITSDADCTIKNRGSLRMNGGTVATSNAEGTVIDCTGNFGDTWINGGTIKGGQDGILLKDLGGSGVTLKNAAFENNTQSNIHLGAGQKINIKKTFTGTAKILTDDADIGRRITLENEDLSYQNKLKLFSMNPGYIIGYKRGEDGKEYRYLADANGNAVSTQDAKATADLGAGAQQLDTTDVVPEGKDVTVTADIPEGAEFLGWSVSRIDGEALDWTPARDDPQTITFTMPGCNVTVEALYKGGNGGIDNPSGGGSSDVVAGIAAVALTGAAVWGIYETGTGIYRVLNMPGVPMPSNRAGLATLIWEKAGCPEPQTVKSFSDIDDADLHLRQAASWMEEQGLMDDVKENEFRPYRYVTKLQTCLVWDKAKEKSLIS